MTAKVIDFVDRAIERDMLTLKKQRELMLSLTASGAYAEALELGEQLVLRLHESGDHATAQNLACVGLPALRNRIRYGR